MFAVKRKYVIILLLLSVVLGITAVILFVTYKDSNSFINRIATTLLLLAFLTILWLQFYSSIKPVWVGIIFAIILFVVFLIVSLIVRHFNPDSGGYLIAIPILFALAALLSHFEGRISRILMSIASKLKL